jgi:hypothetical protein
MATKMSEIKAALREAGITGLKIDTFGPGVVVNDGDSLWTCRAEDMLRGAESLVEDGTAERLRRLDGDDEAGRYDALCRRVRYLAHGNEADRALHEQLVAAWREAHQGSEGNWS